MKKFFQRHRSGILIGFLLVTLLLFRQMWSLVLFPDIPFGYDAGMYRYLFFKHAESLPPFSIVTLPPWAASHPLGLFFFSSMFLKLGIPVDMLIGWMWNVFPVILSIVFAIIFARRNGRQIGLLVLLVSLLSTVQYQGFLMMYWKVFAAFFWCILAFSAFEKRSMLWIFFGMMVIATHQQIGLVFVLATFSSILCLPCNRTLRLRKIGEWGLSLVLGMLWYIPNAEQALLGFFPMLTASLLSLVTLGVIVFLIGVVSIVTFFPRHSHAILFSSCILLGCVLLLLPLTGIAPTFLDSLLHRSAAVPGAFLTIPEYLELSLPLLLLGIAGLFLSFEREKGTVWQFAAVWCGIAVLSLFFFYRRFILPLDFFLLPFAALSIQKLWFSRTRSFQILGIALVLVQGYLLIGQIRVIDPHVDNAMLSQLASLHAAVEPATQVIVLDIMAPWVVGYLPDNAVSGPGIFDSQPLFAWEKFLYGTDADRSAFISHYPQGTYFFATDVFRSYYPPAVQSLFLHACLKPMHVQGLFRSACGDPVLAQP